MNVSRNDLSKEIAVSTAKSLFNLLPIIGTALDEAFFEIRGRIKQKRLNDFLISLGEYFEEIDESKIDFENLKSEDFSDVFESIIKKIVTIKSKDKLERFKKILINEIEESSPSNFKDTFLDLTATLSEKQIEILCGYFKVKLTYDVYLASLNKLENKKAKLEKELAKQLEHKQNGYAHKYDLALKNSNDIIKKTTLLKTDYKKGAQMKYAAAYNLDEKEFLLLVQDMIGKALLFDAGVGGIGRVPFEVLEITEFGKEYIKFIEFIE